MDFADPVSAATSRRMRATGSRDTRPELALRRELHRRGRRFRVDAPLPAPLQRRRADVLFPRRRVAVFVDGCFWHGCPEHGRKPSTNSVYWAEKLARNRTRDRRNGDVLAAAGWLVLRYWEHVDVEAASEEVVEAVLGRRAERAAR